MNACALCGRRETTTRHHLFPRSMHRRIRRRRREAAPELQETVDLCPPCHRRIHELFTEKQLAQEFASLERLKAHEAVRAWLEWIGPKPQGFRPKTVGWNVVRRGQRRG